MRVPSIQALRALEAFARHGSVWRTAAELNLTRSAVSHQLRLLERELGFPLLERDGRLVRLTARGRRYAGEVAAALAALAGAAAGEAPGRPAGRLAISSTPAFAALFLCPEIGDFQRLYPEIELSVLTPRRLEDISDPEVDLFIAFGDGAWPRAEVEKLSDVAFAPMLSPVLLTRAGGLARPADALRLPLLHLGGTADWARWLAHAGVALPDPLPGIVLSDMNLVLAAAAAGQGIAMGDTLTCGRALQSGLVVRPFDLEIPAPGSYWLVTDRRRGAAPPVAAFRAWLRQRLAAG